MVSDSSANRLSSVEKTTRIIEQLRELNGARVTELASHMDLAPSTVHIHLSTLKDLGFLTKEGDTYHVGLRFLELGGYALHQRPEIEIAKQKVNEIAEETQERSQYLVEDHGYGIYLHTKTGDRAVQVNARIGRRTPIHASAAGKAILATLPEGQVDKIISRHGLEPLTENTITSREDLYQNLETVRERGYSFNREESIDGLRAVGAPVTDETDTAVGALSLSGPSNRLSGDRFEERLPKLLLGASNELELKIAFF